MHTSCLLVTRSQPHPSRRHPHKEQCRRPSRTKALTLLGLLLHRRGLSHRIPARSPCGLRKSVRPALQMLLQVHRLEPRPMGLRLAQIPKQRENRDDLAMAVRESDQQIQFVVTSSEIPWLWL